MNVAYNVHESVIDEFAMIICGRFDIVLSHDEFGGVILYVSIT